VRADGVRTQVRIIVFDVRRFRDFVAKGSTRRGSDSAANSFPRRIVRPFTSGNIHWTVDLLDRPHAYPPGSRAGSAPCYYSAGATLQGTLVLAILNVRSSYIAETEEATGDGDVPDTLHWWLGDQASRIKTFAVDHDIHTYSCGPNKPGLIELAQQNNIKHYGDVIAEQHVLEFGNCADAESVAAVSAEAGLANRLEVAAPRFAFWKPDDARYRSQSTPK
jgi:hypothetical protein